MDPTTRRVLLSSSKKGDPVYVDEVFSTFLYDGAGATQTITNGIDLSGEGGMVWLKGRTDAGGGSAFGGNINHIVLDTERSGSKPLVPNLTEPQSNFGNVASGGMGFLSNGFQIGYNGFDSTNYPGSKYCSWTFRKAPGFFDCVTWSGDGQSNRAISHSLGSEPGMVIVKRTNGANNWFTYHRSLASPLTKWLSLNQSASEIQANVGSNMWGSMTSTHIGVTEYFGLNSFGGTYVAYIFAHDDAQFGTGGDESIIKCGSYTATGSAQTVDLGFEPQFLITKKSSGTGEWRINDMMRGIVTGGADAQLNANSSGAEIAGNVTCDLTPTGFISNGSQNDSGGTYIYMAIRRPHKPPTAGTDVFDIDLQTSGSKVTTNFVADTAFFAQRAANSEFYVFDRMRGRAYLDFNSNSPAGTYSGTTGVHWDYQDGYDEDNVLNTRMGANAASVYHSFKRAPGFFDTVIYDGNATAGTSHNHNLKAIPEFIICKSFNTGTGGAGFWCYHKDLSTNYAIRLDGSSNGSVAEQSASNYWNSSTHSATTFTLGNYGDINGSGKTFISYLFSTLSDVSKVGSYSGTGNAINVDCGFTSGARYILIKRKDASGNWFVYDSARGIVSGNDPYKLLNTNAVEVTNTDYIDPLNSGFTVTSSAPTGLNASGGTYIFLAIA